MSLSLLLIFRNSMTSMTSWNLCFLSSHIFAWGEGSLTWWKTRRWLMPWRGLVSKAVQSFDGGVSFPGPQHPHCCFRKGLGTGCLSFQLSWANTNTAALSVMTDTHHIGVYLCLWQHWDKWGKFLEAGKCWHLLEINSWCHWVSLSNQWKNQTTALANR